MKLRFDYIKALEAQCDTDDLQKSQRVFSDICKNLVNDFLPPIDREDIAALSYSLLCIKAVKISDKAEFKNQLSGLKRVIDGVFKKSKACGDDIRRLTEININFKPESKESQALNSALYDFYKVALVSYFKNL